MRNVKAGDYLEIYASYSTKLNGFNTNDSSVWTDDTVTFEAPTDMETYTGLQIFL